MLNEKDQKRISKFLSLVLRHHPERIGIALDSSGWTDVGLLLEKVNQAGLTLTPDMLRFVVENNTKKRFSFNETGERIRANQGHSVPVELGYTAQTPPTVLYHGTGRKWVDSIFRSGLEKRGRHHVHLSPDVETALKVGQRHGKPFLFKVLAQEMHRDGHAFYVSENGVWLTDHVPANYLIAHEDVGDRNNVNLP